MNDFRDARSIKRRRQCCYVTNLILAICGVVLLTVASVLMFRLSYRDAKSDGLASPNGPLETFFACDEVSERYEQFSPGLAKISYARCVANQSPFAFLFILAALFTLVTVLTATVSGLRGKPGGLFGFSVMCGLTLALLFMSVYAFLRVGRPLTDFVPCNGLTDLKMKVLEKAKLGTCVIEPDGTNKSTPFWLFRVLLIWAIGWFVSLVALFAALGMMSGLASRMWKGEHYLDGTQIVHLPSTTAAAPQHPQPPSQAASSPRSLYTVRTVSGGPFYQPTAHIEMPAVSRPAPIAPPFRPPEYAPRVTPEPQQQQQLQRGGVSSNPFDNPLR